MSLPRALLLVRHAGTPATRRGDFPLDESLSERARDDAFAIAGYAPRGARVLVSPARRAGQTAEAAEFVSVGDERLRPLDVGTWAGRSLRDIQAQDPDGFLAWMTDPAARPHGGETVAELVGRAQRLLDDLHSGPSEEVVAVTHGSVIRAAVVAVLDAAPSAFWRIEAAPLSLTELHVRGSGWVLQHANYVAER